MPRKRVSMRHIDEVLRLSAQGLSQHEISRSVGISRTSVRNYLERAQQAGLSWPLPESLDSAAIEARLFKRSARSIGPGRPEPNWLEVHREHKRGKHVTLQLLHLEYKQAYPDGWGYTQFCAHYHRWLGRQDVVMRLEYAAGERMFVDFAGDTVPVTDPETGEVWQRAGFRQRVGCQWVSVRGGDPQPGSGVVAGRPRAGAGVLWRVGPRGRARQPQVGRDQGLLV